jgi:phenylacetate-CoA ligase
MTSLETLDLVKLLGRMFTALPGLFRRPYWSRKAIEAYQLRLLKERLGEARQDVPLYREKNLPPPQEIHSFDDWRELPLLRKTELLERPASDRLSGRYRAENLIVSKSSGSTGQALDVYYDRESFNLFVLAGFRLYFMAFRYMPWHRQTYIYTSPYPFHSLLGMFPMEFISTLTPIPDALAKLREHPPDLLVCYPSHLRAIVDQMTTEDFRRIRPRAVNLNSEMSSAAERKYLSDKLGSFVFDDYSSEELTRIASQCREYAYHLFDDLNYIEIVDDEGRPVPEGVVGNIVGSNLHNRAMPLLRYMQGDRGSVRTARCACGRNFRMLEKLEGRKNDAFVLPGGGTVSSGFLLDLTYGIFLDYEGAAQAFCLIQETPEVWTLEIVPGSRWSEEVGARIVQDLTGRLRQPSVRIEIKKVAQVTRTASGKANPIISRVKKPTNERDPVTRPSGAGS